MRVARVSTLGNSTTAIDVLRGSTRIKHVCVLQFQLSRNFTGLSLNVLNLMPIIHVLFHKVITLIIVILKANLVNKEE